jgi:hemerythrin-like metal-binding protein
MVSAGLLIWWQRRSYRKALLRQRHRQGAAAGPGKGDAGLVSLVWRTEYESGHLLIDVQHRKLFELGNTLLNAILDKQSKLDVELMLEDLISDISNHFCTEETLLSRANHPLTPEHQAIHRTLLARCKAMAERYHRNELKVGDLFQFVAIDVVSDHIIKEDLRFLAQTE